MRVVTASIKQVFSRATYIGLAAGIAVLVFSTAIWLPNLSLVAQVVLSSSATFIDKVRFLTSLYGSIGTNFTVISATYTILIAMLFGVSISMFVYYVRQQQGMIQASASVTGIGGLISGFFGIGCAACGTFLLTSVLGLVGAGGILTFLPFGGEEFGFLGVGLLGFSMYKTSELIQRPKVC